MPNLVRIDKIFKDVKSKVLKNAYVPKNISTKYKSEFNKDTQTIILMKK